MTERRRFSRIIYRVPATLTQGLNQLDTTIQDLSLHGLLLETSSPAELDLHSPVEICFVFSESEQSVCLNANIVSLNQNAIRLKISSIDIDSISQLRRFIELNVGSDELLNRELEHLSDLGAE
ncbi:pilus assembly protein PilZ [Vibrio rotiferianus]|jgi:type II secretory pathway component PulL|uniref:PilZ domain-containing protein n=1 Tax=Vibrio rotiferianus TaxID=190895 RepID=UPI001110702E|nr:PilZ domain-containing protein [Vibrio rotiferianus]TMX36653.1 pilus assembly protein PilZ [Vibrio rotiferianus]TMX60313.1 pilus assembly protein PilZ [Vibrio rotiferianus]TMX63903.1 pilus assembly protein PilZ [Vibrio rotiferianus]TMX72990.1 pilus assembly protein PilZ [Vibrio rotiferianus]